MIAHVVAIALGMLGSSATLLAQTAGGGSDFGPWAQAGGTATAVGALAYVAKLLADGRLVAQPIAELAQSSREREAALRDLIDKHKELALDSHQREEALRLMLIHDQRDRSDRGNRQ